jgi:hypothetical protein
MNQEQMNELAEKMQDMAQGLRKYSESVDIAVDNMLEVLNIYQTNMKKLLAELEELNNQK